MNNNEPQTWTVLSQTDTMFHARISNLLLAQAIFFAAAASVQSEKALILVFCVIGAMTAIIFTISNIKLHVRLTWLIERIRPESPFYTDFIKLKDLDNLNLPKTTLWFSRRKGNRRYLRYLRDSGWLLTWGLGSICVASWFIIALLKLMK